MRNTSAPSVGHAEGTDAPRRVHHSTTPCPPLRRPVSTTRTPRVPQTAQNRRAVPRHSRRGAKYESRVGGSPFSSRGRALPNRRATFPTPGPGAASPGRRRRARNVPLRQGFRPSTSPPRTAHSTCQGAPLATPSAAPRGRTPTRDTCTATRRTARSPSRSRCRARLPRSATC